MTKAEAIRADIHAEYRLNGGSDIAKRHNVRRAYVNRLAYDMGIKVDKAAMGRIQEINQMAVQKRKRKITSYSQLAREEMKRTMPELERLALYGKWRSDYPRELREPCPR